MPGTRSRLRAVDASGARIAIEHGTASFQVTPSADHRWQVDVGPFLVTVKGTVFTVSWDAASERFELKLRHGRVTVSGPVTGGEIALRAGQRLLVDLPQGETMISEPKARSRPPNGRPPRPTDPRRRAAKPAVARRPPRGPTASAGGPRRWPPGISTASSPRPSAPA